MRSRQAAARRRASASGARGRGERTVRVFSSNHTVLPETERFEPQRAASRSSRRSPRPCSSSCRARYRRGRVGHASAIAQRSVRFRWDSDMLRRIGPQPCVSALVTSSLTRSSQMSSCPSGPHRASCSRTSRLARHGARTSRQSGQDSWCDPPRSPLTLLTRSAQATAARLRSGAASEPKGSSCAVRPAAFMTVPIRSHTCCGKLQRSPGKDRTPLGGGPPWPCRGRAGLSDAPLDRRSTVQTWGPPSVSAYARNGTRWPVAGTRVKTRIPTTYASLRRSRHGGLSSAHNASAPR